MADHGEPKFDVLIKPRFDGAYQVDGFHIVLTVEPQSLQKVPQLFHFPQSSSL